MSDFSCAFCASLHMTSKDSRRMAGGNEYQRTRQFRIRSGLALNSFKHLCGFSHLPHPFSSADEMAPMWMSLNTLMSSSAVVARLSCTWRMLVFFCKCHLAARRYMKPGDMLAAAACSAADSKSNCSIAFCLLLHSPIAGTVLATNLHLDVDELICNKIRL